MARPRPQLYRRGIDQEAHVRSTPFVRLRLAGILGAAALLALPATAGAAAAGMHPKLAARLAGMGEHGVVNLQSKASSHQLCWAFDLPTATGITGASIHAGAKGPVLLRLGKTYSKKGCTRAPAMALEHLEAKPGAYWVFVDTKGHPGDLRGRLFAGMARM
jgi:hypothetical protein